MGKVPALAIVLVVLGIGSLIAGVTYTSYYYRPSQNYVSQAQNQVQNPQGIMNGGYPQPSTQPQPSSVITMGQAKAIAEQYLTSTGNPNLAVKEIMEFQYNFYIIYYEKDTGRGAFEMLIWKQSPSRVMGGGMMWGGATVGAFTPEPGPNMMWNTKYGYLGSGIMGIEGQASSTMTVSQSQAEQFAQAYLGANFQNAKTEMATQFYGYFTFDFTVNGKIAGMLSVNGNTGQVWYHSWHGAFIQEVEFD
jgi:hypothetical protein